MGNNEDLFTAAQATLEAGDATALAKLLEAHPELTGASNPAGATLLSLACDAFTGHRALPPQRGSAGHGECVDLLLAKGPDPDASDATGWAPLHTAAMTGNRELVTKLLNAGASPAGQLMGARGGSALALALFYAQTSMGDALANPATPDNLRCAAALGRDMERFFVGGELTEPARDGLDFYRPTEQFPAWDRRLDRQELLDEALTWASRNGQLGSMERLVNWGANVNANPYRGTALLWAVYSDQVDAAAWLLDHGADPDLKHDFGGTTHGTGAVALHLAAQYSGLKCLNLLLERGASTAIQDDGYHATPLGWAEYAGAEDSVRLLKAHLR